MSRYNEVIPEVHLGHCQVSKMGRIVGTVECISPLMRDAYWNVMHT